MARKPSYEELIRRLKELEKASRDHSRIEEALRESEARYRGIFENAKSGIAVYRAVNHGEDFVFVGFNKAAEKIDKIKREKVIGRSVLDVFPGVKEFGLFDVFQRVWATGEPEHHPIRRYKDRRIVGWRENFVFRMPSGEVVAVYSDETKTKRAEHALRTAHRRLYRLSHDLEKKVQERTAELEEKTEKLVEAEKLAALGRMANRVAHESRNSLTVIGGFARRLYEKTPEDDPDKTYLKTIFKEVQALENKVSEIIKLKDL